jgi:hypothetical protein
MLEYDIGGGALKPFGFNYADRVDTPKGPATGTYQYKCFLSQVRVS